MLGGFLVATHIDGDTRITLTMTQLILAILALLGGAWGLLQWTTSGVREDVSAIRQSVQASDKEGVRRAGEADVKLANEIGLLRTSIASLDGKIGTFATKLDVVDKSSTELATQMQDLRKQLAYRQAIWTDPKSLQAFATALKNSGIDEQRIVIVPFDGTVVPIKPQ
jgi:septal ring factor EnvC (AmiA/AmiB activator)